MEEEGGQRKRQGTGEQEDGRRSPDPEKRGLLPYSITSSGLGKALIPAAVSHVSFWCPSELRKLYMYITLIKNVQ